MYFTRRRKKIQIFQIFSANILRTVIEGTAKKNRHFAKIKIQLTFNERSHPSRTSHRWLLQQPLSDGLLVVVRFYWLQESVGDVPTQHHARNRRSRKIQHPVSSVINSKHQQTRKSSCAAVVERSLSGIVSGFFVFLWLWTSQMGATILRPAAARPVCTITASVDWSGI